jgi:hypothetical protein
MLNGIENVMHLRDIHQIVLTVVLFTVFPFCRRHGSAPASGGAEAHRIAGSRHAVAAEIRFPFRTGRGRNARHPGGWCHRSTIELQ